MNLRLWEPSCDGKSTNYCLYVVPRDQISIMIQSNVSPDEGHSSVSFVSYGRLHMDGTFISGNQHCY